jgi:hypothetical protein
MQRDEKGKFVKKDTNKTPETDKPEPGPAGTDAQGPENDTGIRQPMETLEDVKADAKNPPEKKRGPGRPKKKPAAKRGPGRPKKQPEPEPPAFDVDAEMMKMGIKTLSQIAARHRGQHWILTDEEIETLAQVSDAMAQKYFPLLGPWMVEINFFGALIMVLGPRVYIDYMARKAQLDAANKAAHDRENSFKMDEDKKAA